MGPGINNNVLTVNEEVEIITAEVEVEYPSELNHDYDEYHIVFTEDY